MNSLGLNTASASAPLGLSPTSSDADGLRRKCRITIIPHVPLVFLFSLICAQRSSVAIPTILDDGNSVYGFGGCWRYSFKALLHIAKYPAQAMGMRDEGYIVSTSKLSAPISTVLSTPPECVRCLFTRQKCGKRGCFLVCVCGFTRPCVMSGSYV